jgi:cytochrome P450
MEALESVDGLCLNFGICRLTICSSTFSRRFREWAKEYGSVFSLKFGPTNIVVLTDRKAIHELLDKKGAIYSDRPPSYVGRLLTQGDHIALEQMDPVWREKRKVIAHNFSPKQLDEKHFLVQEAEFVARSALVILFIPS